MTRPGQRVPVPRADEHDTGLAVGVAEAGRPRHAYVAVAVESAWRLVAHGTPPLAPVEEHASVGDTAPSSAPWCPPAPDHVATLRPTPAALTPEPAAVAVADTAPAGLATSEVPARLVAEYVQGLPVVDLVDEQAFIDAIADPDRVPIVDLGADWDRDGYLSPLADLTDLVTQVTVTRDLAGDLPAEVGLVEGAAAAALQVTLEGQPDDPDEGGWGALDPVAAFAPYREESPLFGAPVVRTPIRFDSGFVTRDGRETRRRFTGSISRVQSSSRDRRVTVDALDGANRMRAPIYQAAVAMDGLLAKRYGPARYNARINSQWLIDRCFRAGGYFASPPPQPNSFLSATLHGSQVPEIGSGGVPEQVLAAVPDADRPWIVGDHPFGMLAPNPDAPRVAGYWYAPEALTMLPGDGVGCAFWARMPPRRTTALLMQINMDGGALTGPLTNHHVVEIDLLDGAPAAIIATPTSGVQGVSSSTYTLPEQPRWRFIGIHFAFLRGEVSITINHDGDTQGQKVFPLTLGRTNAPAAWAPSTTVFYRGSVPMTNVSWFRSPFPPARDFLVPPPPDDDDEGGEEDIRDNLTGAVWVGASWSPQADIDPGLNELTGIPQIDGEDSWELATEVAAAEAAVIGFDEHDRPYFRSRAVTRSPGVAERVTDDRIADFAATVDESSVRNSISSTSAALLVGDYEWVVEARDVGEFEIGGGANIFHLQLPPDTVLVDPWYVLRFNRAGYEALGDHPLYRASLQYCAVYARRPAVLAPTNAVSFRLFPRDAGLVTLIIYNATRHALRFQTEDVPPPQGQQGETQPGTPLLRIAGRKLTAQATRPQNIHDPGSVALYGPRTLDLGGGRWHQHGRAVAGIAEGILPATAHPSPVIEAITVPHDPRRRLTHPITLVDPHGLGEADATVVGIRETHTVTGPATDDLTVRPLAPPGFGVLDHPVRGRVGRTLRFGA